MKNPLICPVCGSNEIIESGHVYRCRYCDTSFEKEVNDESVHELVERKLAEDKLRQLPPDFDTAKTLYQDLMKKYPLSSEMYWGFIRAKYGIKYEFDNTDRTIVPICFDGEYRDFTNDPIYLKAIELAETDELKERYKSEATRIKTCFDKYQKQSLESESYDVFISFKNREDDGSVTKDFKEMKSLYNFLTGKGLKVFFSPISMLEHVGEPYYDVFIYNALSKAKALIVYGSKLAYFESSWIENEYMRYINLIKNDQKSKNSLLVVVDNLNFDDLPRVLKHRQGIDISKEEDYEKIVYARINSILHGVNMPVIDEEDNKNFESVEDKGEQPFTGLFSRKKNLQRGKELYKEGRVYEAYKFLLEAEKNEYGEAHKLRMNIFNSLYDAANKHVEREEYIAALELVRKIYSDECNAIISDVISLLQKKDFAGAYKRIQHVGTSSWYDRLKALLHPIYDKEYIKAEPHLEKEEFYEALELIEKFYEIPNVKDAMKALKKGDFADAYKELKKSNFSNLDYIAELIRHKYYDIADEQLKKGDFDKVLETYEAFNKDADIVKAARAAKNGQYGEYIKLLNTNEFTFPKNISVVEKSCFAYNSTLKKITIPEGVKAIAESAFESCYALVEVVLPKTLETIGPKAFKGCDKLKIINFEDNITLIGESAFEGCSSLERIKLPKNLEKIDIRAFYGCKSIYELVIPDGLNDISTCCFYGCSSLTKIKFGKNVRLIATQAFYNCTALSKLEFPEALTQIGESAFYGCKSLYEVNFTKNITSIGNTAFCGCSSLVSAKLNDGVASIGERVFDNCSSLAWVFVPFSTTKLGSLTTAQFGQSSIGFQIFYGATSNYHGFTYFKNIEVERHIYYGNNWHWSEDGRTPMPN